MQTYLLMRVQIFMQASERLRDIRAPVGVAQSLLPYFIGGALLFGVLLFGAWYALQRWRQRGTSDVAVESAAVIDSAEAAAYRRLAALEGSAWLEQGELGRYHTELADLLRHYVTARYEIPALVLTTTGLRRAMVAAAVAERSVESFQRLLAQCDRVKFATYQPGVSEASACVTDARQLIDATTPQGV